ncbi:MAG: hypothetical protein AB7J40_05625 [Candidatus Altimarinota bacterium]
MKTPKKIVEVRFYDRELRRSHEPSDAFEHDEDSATTRFVATYAFSVRERILTVNLGRVVFHFFHPGALLNHLDYIVNVLQKRRGDEMVRFRDIHEQERQSILEILLATVIGGGIAGTENGTIGVTWHSGSIKDELGSNNPKIPSPKVLQDRLMRRLHQILSV